MKILSKFCLKITRINWLIFKMPKMKALQVIDLQGFMYMGDTGLEPVASRV